MTTRVITARPGAIIAAVDDLSWVDAMDQQTQCVFMASGEIHAQQVRAFLEAAGIATFERGEALRHTHGLTLDGLGAGR